jgi:hypothetical protein
MASLSASCRPTARESDGDPRVAVELVMTFRSDPLNRLHVEYIGQP